MPPLIKFVVCLFLAIFGRNRKFGFWGYLFGSLLLSPVIGLLLVIGSDVRADKKKPEKKLEEPKPKASKGFFRRKDKSSPVEEASIPVENTGNQ
jgi:hypothetical protein